MPELIIVVQQKRLVCVKLVTYKYIPIGKMDDDNCRKKQIIFTEKPVTLMKCSRWYDNGDPQKLYEYFNNNTNLFRENDYETQWVCVNNIVYRMEIDNIDTKWYLTFDTDDNIITTTVSKYTKKIIKLPNTCKKQYELEEMTPKIKSLMSGSNNDITLEIVPIVNFDRANFEAVCKIKVISCEKTSNVLNHPTYSRI